MPPGTYELGGETVYVDEAAARRADGTLSGSIVTLDQAVRNVIDLTGTSIASALRMASETPAAALGLEHLGRIVEGADADLVLLDEVLRVQATLVHGRCVYPSCAKLAV
jgi:N-acetylglucosamine-6-phosphate deacetylase